MRNEYRFKKRKGRKIQVIFRILPGQEINTGTNDEVEAVQFAERYLQDFDKNRNITNLPTFKEYASGFYSEDKHGFRKQMEKKKKYFKEEYWSVQESRLQNYWIKKFGNLLITAITSDMIDAWYMDLKSKKSKMDLADNSKNKILACGDNVFRKALRDKIISENPISNVEKITEENESREDFNDIEISKLFPTDEKELLRIWLTDKWVLYFLIMRDTGWRPGEVAGLKRNNYHAEAGGLYTETSINYFDGTVQDRIKTSGKGKNFKIGYLSNYTIELLDKYLKNKEIPVNSLIFKSSKGSGLKPEVSNKHFKASCDRAGIKRGNRTQYSLRHTFDTKMLELLDKETVNALMGHTSYRKEYDHRSPETLLKQYKDVRDKLG